MSGWFPRFSPNGRSLASGNGQLVVNGQIVDADGGGPIWFDETHVLFTRWSDGALMWYGPNGVQLLRAQGGNQIASDGEGRHWAIARKDPPRIIFDTGWEEEGFSDPVLARDGTFAATRQADGALVVGVSDNVIHDAPSMNPRFGSRTLMWESGARVYGRSTVAQPTTDLTIPRLRQYKPVPVWTGAQLWFLSHDDGRVLLQPWGDTRGYVLYEGETDGPHDACPIDLDVIAAAWSVKGVLHTTEINLDAPRVDLTPPVQIPVPPLPPAPPQPPVHEEPPPMNDQEKTALVNLCATPCPQDVTLYAIDQYLEHVLARDRCGDSMSRGALMFFIPHFSAAIARNLGIHGMPSGAPADVARGWIEYASDGATRAIAAYENAVNPL